jgi:hypothetical protein
VFQKVIVFQRYFFVLEVLGPLFIFEPGSSLSGTFKIIDQVYIYVLEQICHYYYVPDMRGATTVHPKDSVQAVEPANQAIWVLLKELKIWF